MDADESSLRLLLPVLFLLLLAGSALFSASETAIFSIPSFRIQRLKEEKRRGGDILVSLLEQPHRLLITIITGNTLVNTLAASVAAIATLSLFAIGETTTLLVDWVGVTFILLVVGEVTPKLYAISHSQSVSLRVSPFMRVCYYLFYPLTHFFVLVSNLMSFLLPSTSKTKLTSKQFMALVEVAKEHGVLIEEVEKIAVDAFAFGEKKVKEVMTHRVDIEALPSDITVGEARRRFRDFTHSRIPIYSESLDQIEGILYSKDLLLERDRSGSIRLVARRPHFVPESKRVLTLMRELQSEKTAIAVVVDEYGGTSGLITLEDIVEELVGEIRDESDVEPPLLRRVQPKVVVVNPIIDIHDLNEQLDLDLPSDDFTTLAGLILDRLGRVPQEGESVKIEALELIIEEVRERRIERVRVFLP